MFTQFAYTTTNQEMVGMDEQFPEFHGRVRFDRETKKGSVLDVIHVMTGQARHHCSRTLNNVRESHPELTQRFELIRINGRGRHTPVGRSCDLMKVVQVLPGARASKFFDRLLDYFKFVEGKFWETKDMEVFEEEVYEEAESKKRKASEELEKEIEEKRLRKTSHDLARDTLAKKMNGITEVKTFTGLRCDILTNDYVIEVKNLSSWHHAIGQAQVYAKLLGRKPAVHFYDGEPSDVIVETCRDLGVKIVFLETKVYIT